MEVPPGIMNAIQVYKREVGYEKYVLKGKMTLLV